MKNKIRLPILSLLTASFFLLVLMVPGCGGGGKKERARLEKTTKKTAEIPSSRAGLVSDPIKGRKVFEEKNCSQCHSIFSDEEKMGPNLEMSTFYGTFLDIYSILWNHAPAMAVHMRKEGLSRPQFSTVELNELISFLYMLPYFDEPGNATKGEALLSMKKCLTCHSIGGKGKERGVSLDALKAYSSQVALIQSMWNHGPVMLGQMISTGTAIPSFSGSEMTDLFAALSKTTGEKKHKVAIAIGSASEGKKVFKNKGCLKCHAIFGEGGKEAPDLGKAVSQSGVGKLTALLWNHVADMQEKFREKKVTWPYFSETEMSDLIVYLYSLNYFDPPGKGKKGEKLFAEKNCADCHLSSQGNYKEVMKRVKNLNTLQFATRLWNHYPTMEAAMVTQGIEWPELSGQGLRDIHAFLTSQ